MNAKLQTLGSMETICAHAKVATQPGSDHETLLVDKGGLFLHLCISTSIHSIHIYHYSVLLTEGNSLFIIQFAK